MKSRTLSRVTAMQGLYALEFNSAKDLNCCYNFLELEQDPFALELINYFLHNSPKIDSLIRKNLTSWTLERVNYIDRNLIRLGICELMMGTVDRAVIINEYVEIAKVYGTEKSAAFVNGLLDSFKDT